LEELRLFLEQTPRVTALRIEGHTDNVGNEENNLELSGQRALTVKRWLINKGIASERLLAVGFGDKKPLADNATVSGRAQNRRTEFKVATWEGKPFLGREPTGGGKVFDE
jgi:OOP family OmpA-OmpF porin